MNWVNQYIGAPFKDHGRDPSGWDCWGLVWWCLQQHFNTIVPSYTEEYDSALARKSIAKAITTHRKEWYEVSRERPGDVLLLRMSGAPIHVGLCIGGGLMLHVLAETGTVAEPYNEPHNNIRIIGAFRYAST